MKKLMMIALAACAAAMMAGCFGTPGKVRDIGLKGMYVNGYSETLAIGMGRLTSIPGEREAFAAHYREDTAWLQPNIKTHELDLFIVGTNSTASASDVVKSICLAFAEVTPTVSSNNTAVAKAGGTSPLDVVKAGGEVRKAVQATKAAASATQASKAVATAAEAACTGDSCTAPSDGCAGGVCEAK